MYGSEPLKPSSLQIMKKTIQFLSIAVLALISAVASAQPVPPYTIWLTGSLSNCSPAGSNIQVLYTPDNITFETVTVPVTPNCTFGDTIYVSTPSGTLSINYPCNGALETISATYSIDLFGFASVVLNLNCISNELDCLGIPGGSAVPGSPCDDNDANTVNDAWTASCTCEGEAIEYVDCLGVPNGSAVAGTPCDDNDPMTSNDTWNANCECAGDTTVMYDCLGVAGGTAWPGTPCDDNNPDTYNDYWTADCLCQGIADDYCEANFWVLQGYTFGNGNEPGTIDSTIVIPIPNEIWVWNLSSSSTGNMTFLWTFGDGTSSTDAYPTHVYDGTGPYELCLTITDGFGCQNTYCQTITVDGEGIFNGIVGNQNDDRSVITLNVVAEQPIAANVTEVSTDIALWPNPVQNVINMSIKGKLNGQVNMSIVDMNGKVVTQSSNVVRSGNNQVQIDVTDLKPGMYMMQIGNGTQTTTRRFVKQ